ncbi:MAG: sulfatase-like hydrolase/transferase, partial [Planctomycetaceae bacterium]|nr:sulfatase-like hydrolase/transferase [Planctomycetaceae bacterium]
MPTSPILRLTFSFGLLLTSYLNGFASDKPNVVIFFTDDQGTLDANCFGSKDLYTPTMDQLAQDGIRFTQAYAHAVCCPARAMLMTGRYPQRSGVNNWTQGNAKSAPGINMSLDEVTLAEALHDAGYQTALFGKWHLGAHVAYGPTKQGFDEFFGHRGGFIHNYNHFFLVLRVLARVVDDNIIRQARVWFCAGRR